MSPSRISSYLSCLLLGNKEFIRFFRQLIKEVWSLGFEGTFCVVSALSHETQQNRRYPAKETIASNLQQRPCRFRESLRWNIHDPACPSKPEAEGKNSMKLRGQ